MSSPTARLSPPPAEEQSTPGPAGKKKKASTSQQLCCCLLPGQVASQENANDVTAKGTQSAHHVVVHTFRDAILADATSLRDGVDELIEEHKCAASYCMTYNNLCSWLHTLTAAVTVALSATLQATKVKGAISIALIVLTALTTAISFWQNVCRFPSRFTNHSLAIPRYRTLLAEVNNFISKIEFGAAPADEKDAKALESLLKESDLISKSCPSIPPWIIPGKLSVGDNAGTFMAFVLLWMCNCFCGNPTASEDTHVARATRPYKPPGPMTDEHTGKEKSAKMGAGGTTTADPSQPSTSSQDVVVLPNGKIREQ